MLDKWQTFQEKSKKIYFQHLKCGEAIETGDSPPCCTQQESELASGLNLKRIETHLLSAQFSVKPLNVLIRKGEFASTHASLLSSITQGMMSCLNRTFSDTRSNLSELTSCIFGRGWCVNNEIDMQRLV